MTQWNELLRGALPYQEYWMPLIIGMAAGMMCIFVGNLVWRGKRAATARAAARTQPEHDPFQYGSLTEKRQSLRRTGNPVEVFFARPESKHIASRALVLDRSMGGLRLGANEEIAPGTHLIVLPTNASEMIPWIEIEVRRCQLVEDSWELNCQFVKTPQWSVLLLFG